VFNKLLIANRGEIACRIIRTARRLGIATVAVYSEADRHALHVAMADEALLIGGPAPLDSYLRGDAVLGAARRSGADAIHPGYGFLSENAAFCASCAEAQLAFIGPPAAAIEAMGSKSTAKRMMQNAGIPLVPGYHEPEQTPTRLQRAADDIGYPILLKAVAGGGGKGMRVVESAAAFDAALAGARREADKAFGDATMLVEKYLQHARHVEIQIFCDTQGNGVYLFDRDCSVQRRHQKIIEEAPAPGLNDALRQRMGDTAVCAALAIDYRGAGTVEFLLEPDGCFYFIEMNTRLQVEHPVTEMITGLDLVEWQLRVAAGEPLPLRQQELTRNGHAFEARIYAEDPARDFLPVTGTLCYLRTPEESRHLRIDSGVRQGDAVSIYYDPMIAKLIVWDEDRGRALRRLSCALAEYRISGITTNIDFLYNLVNSAPFQRAELDTGFIDRHGDAIAHGRPQDIARALPLAALYLLLARTRQAAHTRAGSTDPWSPWQQVNGWRLNEPHLHHFALDIQGQTFALCIEQQSSDAAYRYLINCDGSIIAANGELQDGTLLADIEGHRQQATIAQHDNSYSLYTADGALQFRLATPDFGEGMPPQDQHPLSAPINGIIVTLLVEAGCAAAKGDALLVMEAMKMEHTIRAPAAGRVAQFFYQPGDLVDGGAQLMEFETDE
jgi:3-methylcrotonyl-CoA carboxylase alpha subunit